MTIKTAQALIDEFVRTVHPPQSCAIVLTEIAPSLGFDFNWLASAGRMSAAVMQRYDNALHNLKRENRRIDWESVTDLDDETGARRIVRYLSEVK